MVSRRDIALGGTMIIFKGRAGFYSICWKHFVEWVPTVPWRRSAPDCRLESNEVIFIIRPGRGQQLWAVAGHLQSEPQWIFSPGTKEVYIITQDGVILWPVTPSSSPHVSQPCISDLRCFTMCCFVHEMRLPASLHWSGKLVGQGMIESFTLYHLYWSESGWDGARLLRTSVEVLVLVC